MRKKFNKLMNISLGTSIVFIIIGIILLFFTKMSLDLIAYLIAGVLIINGVFSIIDDYKQFKIFYFFDDAQVVGRKHLFVGTAQCYRN